MAQSRNHPVTGLSITQIVPCITESLIESKLRTCLLDHNHSNTDQHGFFQSISSSSRMTDFWYMVTKAANDEKSMNGIFLDMTDATDRVPHHKLPINVKICGMTKLLLARLSSNLISRLQVVNISGTLSRPLPITIEVIQGSVLGKLLFLLCINDIFHTIRHCIPFRFAWDIQSVHTFHPCDFKIILDNIKMVYCYFVQLGH